MAYVKDPGEVKDYAIDWTAHLAAAETITTSTWVVATGITKDSDTLATPLATIWLSGGTEGTEYRVTNHVVTNQGREFERSFMVNVQQL
jgi:hypothetical protein